MNKKSIISIHFIFFLITIQPTMGQAGRFGQIAYTVPAGWKETKYQNGVQLAIATAANELLTIQLLQALNFSGTMEQALDKSYDESCSILQVTKMREVNGKNYDTKASKKSFKGWEYIRGSGGIQVNNGTPYPDEYGLELFVIKINSRFERIAIVKSRNTCGGLSRYYPSDRLSYHQVIEGFLFSLKFDDWQDPVIKLGTIMGPGITGAWQGLSLSVGGPKHGAQLGAELTVKQLILFSNGQAYFGKNFPGEGLDGLNTWIAAENNQRDWGTYTFVNETGNLKMPYGDIPLRMENNRLIITTNKTKHGFIKLNPVDGATFNGTYVLGEAYGIIPSISFTPGSKFRDNGALRILYHEYIECLNPALTPGSGIYEVKNYSVIFTYTDGRKIKIAYPGTDFDRNNSGPVTLMLSYNSDKLTRE